MAEENLEDFDVPDFPGDISEEDEPPREISQEGKRMPPRDDTGRFLPNDEQRQRPRPLRPRPPVTMQQHQQQAMQQQQAATLPQQQAIQQAQPIPAQARFIPYEIPKKVGLLDRSTGRPLIEDEDMLRVIMAQLADLKNDIEELKAQLYSG